MSKRTKTKSNRNGNDVSEIPGERFSVERLENRMLLSTSLSSIATQSVPSGTTLYVPLTAGGANKVTYTVKSSNGAVVPSLEASTTYLTLNIAGYGAMTFQLFGDVAPKTVAMISGMVRAGFYNNLKFHRIIKNFVVQAGDPNSRNPYVDNGTVGQNDAGDNIYGVGKLGFFFDDEFNQNTIFNGNGQLAMANGGKDTNEGQFFVTVGAQRNLDFNHTIFGQLIRGFDVLAAINNTPTFTDYTSSHGAQEPTSDIVITSAAITTDPTDGVMRLNVAAGAAQNSLATVTVTAKGDDGKSSVRTFAVNRVANGTNDPPILLPGAANRVTPKNTPIKIVIGSQDPDGGTVQVSAYFLAQNGAAGAVQGNTITVTPASGYTGPLVVKLGVSAAGSTSRGSTGPSGSDSLATYDTQQIFIGVGDQLPVGAGTNVDIAKDVRASNALVASFKDPDGAGTAANWQSSVNWGDGTISAGTVVLSGGTFSVRGSHTYNVAGNYLVTTTVAGNLGARAVFSSNALVRNFAGLTGGLLTVNGSGTNDVLAITKTSSTRVNVTLGGVSRSFPLSSISKIVVNGLDGNDNIAIDPAIAVRASMNGGAGRDTLTGGGGNDTLDGGGSTDSLIGGAGNDSFYAQDGQRDTIDGGLGTDTMITKDAIDSLTSVP